MAKNYVRDNVPLSRFGVLVAQLESIVASSGHKPPDSLLCFDLLSDLVSAIDEEPKESILLWQRKCEDALYSLLVLGARRPVRHLASVAMARIIMKGDGISIYSRASSLQGFLSDGKKSEALRVAGAAQCLGELYRLFGRRITSGLLETTAIVTKLMKFNEDFVRQEALHMLQNALEGCGGSAASSAYTEAFRLIMRLAVGDKSFTVRIAAARCLRAFANIGGPGLGVAELDNSASYCVKALEDPVSSVRDAFAEALGAVLALGMNPEAQVQARGKSQFAPKKLEGGLQRHLVLPFVKASGPRLRDVRIGVTLSWVSLLQAIHLKYLHPDSELQNFALQVMEMLRVDASADAQALACVLYILRVGVTDQMTEPTQRSFLVVLSNQLQSPDSSPSMRAAALRTLSYGLKTLGEVPLEFKEVLDNTVVAALSHSSPLVRVEAALTLRALAEVDPTCVGGLISYGVTTLTAHRENLSFEKGSNLKIELDSFHGQATVLAALVSIAPKLHLGYPARLPRSVLEVCKKMLTESSRNPAAATVETEAGWLLLSSLLASMPKEELEDQIFDILSLWALLFTGNAENQIYQTEDLTSILCVWSAAMDAMTAFIRCFVCHSAGSKGILLQPVLLYLNRALSYLSLVLTKEQRTMKPAMDMFIFRMLGAYLSLSDPMAYKVDHPQIIQICSGIFRDASGCEESSCLRMLLDKRDAWLGPWIPGRDWLEDELRAFQGGKDGDLPCVWEDEVPSFPQPETVSKMSVNQKLLCFGTIFASQDSGGMLSLLGMIEQCLKVGKKQSWHAASVTNVCVGLLAGLKALLALRPQPLGSDILNSAQAIFLSILAEGDICASQRRAASEGLGLLARLGNDIFAARLTRMLLGDLNGAGDSSYAGSIAFALGCIHRCAGGMALSSLVPATVNSLSLLAKSPIAGLQVWSLHGLLLTIEAAGLSYVSQVQATLGLATDILLLEENGWVDLQQGVGRLINAIVAVLGPELAPGSIFFSRCKSVVAEISCRQETATLIENVRFTQQLVIFAPHAVTVHSHVQTLLPTLSSRQPTLRHLAVSTLRHLIEKDPASIIDEQIEGTLFHMLDEETDTEIGNLVRTTIMRLLYASSPLCPSHWLTICRAMVLATSTGRDSGTNGQLENDLNGDSRFDSEDDKNMVSSSKASSFQSYGFGSTSLNTKADKHLRYRTRVFAAECLSHLPAAVGKDPAHFDLSLARRQTAGGQASGDWLVLHVQELISLAYQISTIQFENMRPIGMGLLSTIMDKFEMIPDPDLPGHLLLEQYQAQLVSAVRTALDSSSGPVLLETGLQLATKILTNGMISGDQVAVKRIFSLISRPLQNFEDLYYPSFAEWVSCKIKIRLLTAHASLKCYTYAFLRKQHASVPDEYLAQLPLFSESSSVLGKYWISTLKDFSYVCFRLHLKQNWKPFLDGIQSPLVSAKLQPCLEPAWPVIFQAVALDAVPLLLDFNQSSRTTENTSGNTFMSGYSMVQLKPEEFRFLWGFALLVLFEGQNLVLHKPLVPIDSAKAKLGGDCQVEDTNPLTLKSYEIVLPVFQFLSTEKFFSTGFLTMDICRELLQVFSYSICLEDAWDSLAIAVLSQIVQNCPKDFLETENFASLVVELCLAYLFKVFQSGGAAYSDSSNWDNMISISLATAKTLIGRLESERQFKSMLAFLLIGYKCVGEASTDLRFSKASDFVQYTCVSLKTHVDDESKLDDDAICYLTTIFGACLDVISSFTLSCIDGIHAMARKRSGSGKLLQFKLAFAIEQMYSWAKLGYEVECLGDSQENKPILFSVIQQCTRCIHTVLTDNNAQVLSVVLQVLKSMVQRGNSPESKNFVMFISGELLRDLFSIFDKMLKKPINSEAAAIATECLRILAILQTLSKGSESQKGLMNLLLEAIVMVFSSSDDGPSMELRDLRSMAGKLVSQLAQIPSSAVYLKDVLLDMPAANRQQLQDIIRASVTQEHAPPTKSTVPSLEIKFPAVKEEARQKGPTSLILTDHAGDRSQEEEEEEEEDDDWDTFQSFPASTSEVVSISKVESATEEPDYVEKASVSNFDYVNDEHMGPMPPNTIAESINEDQTATDTATIADFLSGRDEHVDCSEGFNDHHDAKTSTVSFENDRLSDIRPVAYLDEYAEELGDHQLERDGTNASGDQSDPASSDLASIDDTKGSVQTSIPDQSDPASSDLASIDDTKGSVQTSIPDDDETVLPEISDSDVFSESKHPGEIYDSMHREQNEETVADLTSEVKAKNKSTEASEDETEKTVVVGDTAKS